MEKKQTASAKTPEQKFVEEVRSDKSPVIRECDKDATVTRQESMSDVNQETQEKNEDKMIHVLDEDSMKSWVEFWSKESDNEVRQRMENWMSVLQGVKEVDAERANIWKCGMRWVVEARRKAMAAARARAMAAARAKAMATRRARTEGAAAGRARAKHRTGAK